MSRPSLGEDPSLLDVPQRIVNGLESEAQKDELLTQLPRFLRTFYLRFFDEAVGQKIERFTIEEGEIISDALVDLEAEDRAPASWPLLSDFVDLCDYFGDFGLMSVPEAAREHEADILELTARILQDLSSWAKGESHQALAEQAQELGGRLEALSSGTRLP